MYVQSWNGMGDANRFEGLEEGDEHDLQGDDHTLREEHELRLIPEKPGDWRCEGDELGIGRMGPYP